MDKQQHNTPTLGDLEATFETIPLSDARANLSQIVERVAYSGDPVIISKHSHSRIAIVPLDVLARDRARFLTAATAVLESEDLDQEPESEDVAFDQIGGLSAAELDAERKNIDDSARQDDLNVEDIVMKVVTNPIFEERVEGVVTRMAINALGERATASGEPGWLHVESARPFPPPLGSSASEILKETINNLQKNRYEVEE